MAQNKAVHRQRVKVGTSDDGTPVYKWVQGRTLDDLNDAIVTAYVESGRISEFVEAVKPAPQVLSQTFEEYARHWFAVYKSHLKETTKQSYLYTIDHYLVPEFGKKKLQEITTDQIQLLFNKWSGLAKSTIRKMELTLQQIFTSATKDKLVLENPVDRDRLKNPSTNVQEREAISEEHYFDILHNLYKLEVSDRRMIALLLLTGMRRSEVLGLRWEDIDFDDKLIHVSRGVVYTGNAPILSTPKSKKGYRSIPLDERLVELLAPIQTTGYVIGGDDPISKSSFSKLIRRVKKTIDMHGASPHILRHTYATLLNNAGVNPKTIQYILGHADISTTMNRYTHSYMENVREAGRLLCAKLGAA